MVDVDQAGGKLVIHFQTVRCSTGTGRMRRSVTPRCTLAGSTYYGCTRRLAGVHLGSNFVAGVVELVGVRVYIARRRRDATGRDGANVAGARSDHPAMRETLTR